MGLVSLLINIRETSQMSFSNHATYLASRCEADLVVFTGAKKVFPVFVYLSAGLIKKLFTDFNWTWWEGLAWSWEEDPITCYWSSGSRICLFNILAHKWRDLNKQIYQVYTCHGDLPTAVIWCRSGLRDRSLYAVKLIPFCNTRLALKNPE